MTIEEPQRAAAPETERDALNPFEAGLIRLKILGLRVAELAQKAEIIVPAIRARLAGTAERVEDLTINIETSIQTLYGNLGADTDTVAEDMDEGVKLALLEAEEQGIERDYPLLLQEAARAVRTQWEREDQIFTKQIGSGILVENLSRALTRASRMLAAHEKEATQALAREAKEALARAGKRIASLAPFPLKTDASLAERPAALRAQLVKSQTDEAERILETLVDDTNALVEKIAEREEELRVGNPLGGVNPHVQSLEHQHGPVADELDALDALKRQLRRDVIDWANRLLNQSAPGQSVLWDMDTAALILADSDKKLAESEELVAELVEETKGLRKARGKLTSTRKRISELKGRLDGSEERAA